MDRKNVILVSVDNDPESRIICELGNRMGMKLVRSKQLHGARLDVEPNLHNRMQGKSRNVWTVELPGVRTENKLRSRGYTLTIIDHHTYSQLDRSKDAAGNKLPSSLEQFLALAEVTDEELANWGYDPKTVRGIGIMDDRYVRGLKDAGYNQDEINRVLDLRDEIWSQLNKDHEAFVAQAKLVWAARNKWQGYFVMTATGPLAVRGEIGMCMIREGLDEHPWILSERDGSMLYVQNAEPEAIERLQQALSEHRTFTFGAGRCWGLDCRNGAKVDIKFILDVLHLP